MSNLKAIALSPEGGLSQYLQEIAKFPILKKEEEVDLANRWYYDQNTQAAHSLVTSHLRLVAKIAFGYKGYGLPVSDLISEGNIGLMQAVKKFDPRKGFRLSTYAMWWIRAHIQEFILKSWSLVKMGTTASQKKLFFNLRKLKGKMDAYEEGDLTQEHLGAIAKKLDVSEEDVIQMNRRMAGGDQSLNAPVYEEGAGQWQDWLVDDSKNQEQILTEQDEMSKRRGLFRKALETLKPREKEILIKRRLEDPALTLEDLSQEYGVSRERIRQIENRALEKVQDAISKEPL